LFYAIGRTLVYGFSLLGLVKHSTVINAKDDATDNQAKDPERKDC
jgi:hypothetical protein